MKYDDASWHYGGNYPKDLPPENGATHIAMFLAWAVLHDLGGEELLEDSSDQLEQLRSRKITPRAFFLECCDEKFSDGDLNKTGNRFAKKYYLKEEHLEDYAQATGVVTDRIYYAEDGWATYDKLCPLIDARFEKWQSTSKKTKG